MKKTAELVSAVFLSEILADGGKYLRMAENTCGWQKILADGGKYSRIEEEYSRITKKISSDKEISQG